MFKIICNKAKDFKRASRAVSPTQNTLMHLTGILEDSLHISGKDYGTNRGCDDLVLSDTSWIHQSVV